MTDPWANVGPVERIVIGAIEAAGKGIDKGMRRVYAEMALKLARAYDLCQIDDVMILTKASAELRQTLAKLTDSGGHGEDELAALFRRMSTAVRHTEESGESDAGPERCGHCGEPR